MVFGSSIAIATDNAHTRGVLEKLCADFGFTVEHIVSSESLAARIASRNIKLAFFDASLCTPKVQTAVKNINHSERSMLLVVFGKETQRETMLQMLTSGAFDFLCDPFSTEQAKAVIHRLIGEIKRRENRSFSPQALNSFDITLDLYSVSQSVPPTVQLLRTLLFGIVSDKELSGLSLAVDEVLRNAYEHGCLGITSEEKQKACDEERFEVLLKEREALALAKKKNIRVRLKYKKHTFICEIQDSGKGFNWRKQRKQKEIKSSIELLGRGVQVMYKVFDKVQYNAAGNKVTLTKKF